MFQCRIFLNIVIIDIDDLYGIVDNITIGVSSDLKFFLFSSTKLDTTIYVKINEVNWNFNVFNLWSLKECSIATCWRKCVSSRIYNELLFFSSCNNNDTFHFRRSPFSPEKIFSCTLTPSPGNFFGKNGLNQNTLREIGNILNMSDSDFLSRNF